MRSSQIAAVLLLPLTGAACGSPATARQPVFINGRAVAAPGDTLFAVALPSGGVVRLRPGGAVRDTMGIGILRTPLEVQWVAGRWWVSDLEDGAPVLRVFGPAGTHERTVPLGAHTALPHQFAALSDGRVVVEARDGRLLVLGDSVGTFVPSEVGPRPSLLLAAHDGVLHAVPDRTITLYNRFGRIRWRIEWPWVATAHVSDLALDARGRVHVLSGVANDGTFIVYSLEASSGEVTRWSTPEPHATFVADRLGAVMPGDTTRWRTGR